MTPLLYILSFTNGLLVLVLEISAGRIMAPVFGNTTLTWTAIITAVLLGLALGYGFGSWMTGRAKNMAETASHLFFIGGFLTFIAPWFGNQLLFFSLKQLPFQFAALAAAQILFVPPLFFVSALTPLLIEMVAQVSQQSAGKVSGKLFALSTVGSLSGALLTAFVLLPHCRLSSIMQLAALTLLLSGVTLSLSFRRNISKLQKNGLLILFIIVGLTLLRFPRLPGDAQLVWQSQNLYQQHIVREADGIRYLILDRSVHGAIDIKTSVAKLKYTQLTNLIDNMQPSQHDRGLVIGGGSYLIPRLVLANDSQTKITVAEIDPQVEKLARDYFGLTNQPAIQTVFQDGRTFLYQSKQTWNWIWVDAFQDYTAIPAHLLSKEFFDLAASHLHDGGIFLINTVMPRRNPADNPLFQAVAATLGAAFRQYQAFRINDDSHPTLANVVFAASQQPLPTLNTSNVLQLPAVSLPSSALVLSDDFNPSESLALTLYR